MVNIDPQRTECSESNGVYVCHRLFYYHVTNLERRPAPVFVKEQQEEPQVITTKTEVHNHNQIINNNQTYHVDIRKPVVFKEIIIDKKRSDQYRTFVRKSGAVTIYSLYQSLNLLYSSYSFPFMLTFSPHTHRSSLSSFSIQSFSLSSSVYILFL